MKKFTHPDYPKYDLFCSEDHVADFYSVNSENLSKEDFFRIEFESKVNRVEIDFFKKGHSGEHKEYAEILILASKLTGLERVAIFYAHGYTDSNLWMFSDGGKNSSIQRWIDSKDGKYSTLALAVCNPGAYEVKCKKSVVLVPNGIYSGKWLSERHLQIEIVLPKFGYVDLYQAETIIADLRNKLSVNI